MRLTLRNILAYLNDELSPKQTEELGPRIAESEVAQQLIEKLSTLTRRRRLSAPEINLADETSPQEANFVAAYLDCELTEEEQAKFEALCFENDVLLAEVAACMQLNTLGEQSAIKVPPTARLRMLHLVKGKSSIPDRPPSVPASPVPVAPLTDGAAEDEQEALLTLDPLYQQVRHRGAGRLVPLAAGLLLLMLGGLLYWALNQPYHAQPLELAALTNPSPVITPVATRPASKPALRLPTVPQLVADASGQLAGFAAASPTLPPNLLLAFGHDVMTNSPPPPNVPPPAAPTPAATTPSPTPSVPTDTKAEKPPERKPQPAVKVAVGQYESDPAKDGQLFRLLGPGDWRPVRAQSPILTNEALMALPGTRALLALPGDLHFTLLGTLPGDTNLNPNNYYLETAGQFSPTTETDTDLTLRRGRVLVSRKAEGTAKWTLRFRDAVWKINFLHPDTEIALEVTGRLPQGSDANDPRSRLTLAVIKGVVEVERNGQKLTLRDKVGLSWDSKDVAGIGTEQPVALGWVGRRPAPPTEVRDAQTAFQKRLSERLNQPGPSLPWIRVACDEALLSRRPWEQTLAIYTLAAFDQLALLTASLDDERAAVRKSTVEALQHWLGRQPNQTLELANALAGRSFPAADQQAVVELLKGTAEPDKATIERLLGLMKHPRLGIRDLAFRNLQGLVPGEKLPVFDPAASVDTRDRAVEAIKKKLLPG